MIRSDRLFKNHNHPLNKPSFFTRINKNPHFLLPLPQDQQTTRFSKQLIKCSTYEQQNRNDIVVNLLETTSLPPRGRGKVYVHLILLELHLCHCLFMEHYFSSTLWIFFKILFWYMRFLSPFQTCRIMNWIIAQSMYVKTFVLEI